MSDSAWQTLDRLAVVAGLLAFFGTAYSAGMWVRHHLRERTLRQPVPIRLVSAADGRALYELPFQPPRQTVTRAEVLGLLGMIPCAEAGKRLEWAWPHDPRFMQHLDEIYRGHRHSLEIPVTTDEFAQLQVING